MRFDVDFIEDLKNEWNNKVKKVRVGCLILSIVMIAAGVLCVLYPMQSFNVMKIIAALVFIGLGVYAIITYWMTPVYFKDPIAVMSGLTRILFGALLLNMPAEMTAMSLTFMLAVLLLFGGAEKISFSRKLSFFGLLDTRMYTYSGILNMLLGVIFIILPMTSALVINYIIAAYLIIDGISLFIEAIAMRKLKD